MEKSKKNTPAKIRNASQKTPSGAHAKAQNKAKHEKSKILVTPSQTFLQKFLQIVHLGYIAKYGQTAVEAVVSKGKHPSVLGAITRKDIPFWGSLFKKGTECPTFRLKLTVSVISFASSTDYTTVFAVQASALELFSGFGTLFDEYRFIRGQIDYCAIATQGRLWGGTNIANPLSWGVAVIDYGSSTALPDVDAGNYYDTKKRFLVCPVAPDGISLPTISWPVIFEKLPDQEWISSSVTNTVVAYWKPYLVNQFNGTPAPSLITGWFDIGFRGLGDT